MQMDRTRIGTLVGTGVGGVGDFCSKAAITAEPIRSDRYMPCPFPNIGAARFSMDHGLMGPTYSISTACATANCCLYSAANHIRNGEAEVIIAGGTEAPIVPSGIAGFMACRALSQRNSEPEKASRPWDRGRDGFVMGEGAGILVSFTLHMIYSGCSRNWYSISFHCFLIKSN